MAMKNIFDTVKAALFYIDFTTAIANGIEEFNRLSSNRPIAIGEVDVDMGVTETEQLDPQLVLAGTDDTAAV
jgi:hypothetical protein